MTNFDEEKRRFKEWYAQNHSSILSAERSFRNLVDNLLVREEKLPRTKVESRTKPRDECIKKFERKYRTELEKRSADYRIDEHISDLIGVRVVCLYESNIGQIVEVLRHNFDVIAEDDKMAKLDGVIGLVGYRGHHLDLRLKGDRAKLPEYEFLDGFQFEVQVKTIAQDAWGEVDHHIRYKKDLPPELQRDIYNLSALFDTADKMFDKIREAIEAYGDEVENRSEAEPGVALTAFNFLTVAKRYWPKYPFEEKKVEGFVDEIRGLDPGVTIGALNEAMEYYFATVTDYRQYSLDRLGRNLNPFTMTRYVLRAYDQSVFGDLMFPKAQAGYDEWLQGHSEE